MIAAILRCFGYAKVPPEAVALAVQARMTWKEEPSHPNVGLALHALEKLMRSTQ